MSTPRTSTDTPVRVSTHHTVSRRLGRWTISREFEVRARHGRAVPTALFPREYWVDLRRAHREGRPPDVADPAHSG